MLLNQKFTNFQVLLQISSIVLDFQENRPLHIRVQAYLKQAKHLQILTLGHLFTKRPSLYPPPFFLKFTLNNCQGLLLLSPPPHFFLSTLNSSQDLLLSLWLRLNPSRDQGQYNVAGIENPG